MRFSKACLALALAAAVPGQLLADEPTPVPTTRMERVREEYQKAAAPQALTQLEGWFAGRCFHTVEPEKPYGVMLAIETRAYGEAGPLFDRPSTKGLMRIFDSNKATSVDVLDDAERLEMRDYIDENWEKTDELQLDATGAKWGLSVGEFRSTAELRTGGDISYLQLETVIDGQSLQAYCYFFKRMN